MPSTTWQLFAQAGLVVKAILMLLLGCSIGSWAIVLYKSTTLSEAARASSRFLGFFEAQTELARVAQAAQELSASPLSRVFQAVYSPRHRGQDASERLLRRAVSNEQEELYSYLTFLATLGSAAPFVGLLGTVWGIMDAFRGIGAVGSASLAVVAPAIAEALIATAVGLMVAIPAVVAYNGLLRWARKLALQVDQFSEALAERLRSART